jgi:hypothetical protein
VSLPQRRIEFVHGYSDHQIIPDDSAAHSPATEKRETPKHFPFREALPPVEYSSDAVGELFVVRH